MRFAIRRRRFRAVWSACVGVIRGRLSVARRVRLCWWRGGLRVGPRSGVGPRRGCGTRGTAQVFFWLSGTSSCCILSRLQSSHRCAAQWRTTVRVVLCIVHGASVRLSKVAHRPFLYRLLSSSWQVCTCRATVLEPRAELSMRYVIKRWDYFFSTVLHRFSTGFEQGFPQAMSDKNYYVALGLLAGRRVGCSCSVCGCGTVRMVMLTEIVRFATTTIVSDFFCYRQ
jgi:hypothetical protein